jgi:DNA-binding CsgD family transcriptional regulator
MANAARVRGRLEAARGRHAEAEAAFLEGLGQIEQVSMPFERALILLAYGQFLRRLGRRRDAATRLGLAQECFVALGAQPSVDRCDRELAACGLAPARRRSRDRARLTSQELSVVRLVASGLSNREVAAELVVSVKTVEFHLSHAYHKLAVDSRKELASRLQEPGNPRSGSWEALSSGWTSDRLVEPAGTAKRQCPTCGSWVHVQAEVSVLPVGALLAVNSCIGTRAPAVGRRCSGYGHRHRKVAWQR